MDPRCLQSNLYFSFRFCIHVLVLMPPRSLGWKQSNHAWSTDLNATNDLCSVAVQLVSARLAAVRVCPMRSQLSVYATNLIL